jgi:catechol 2,3-dioxygenase-like lactoylglutathione lyase family enzyme
MVAFGPAGMTIQLWVTDGTAARAWYEGLFGRPPDFTPFNGDTFCEWVFKPGYWEVHIVEKYETAPRSGPLRFGVDDVHSAREHVTRLGIDASDVEELPGVVKYCNFTDPWGNRLGLYQDLSRWP